MNLRFPESEICQWADKYQRDNLQLQSREDKLINLKFKIQQRGYLDREELLRVAHWKSPRSQKHVKKNNENYIKEITEWAFTATNERSKVEVLTLLDGINWPTASAILHLFDKDPYPILDFRALWSVEAGQPSQYSFSFWWSYVCFCRDVAHRNEVDMRTLDRALWQYSKCNQRTD